MIADRGAWVAGVNVWLFKRDPVNKRKLSALRERLRSEFHGRRCIVVGSAPGAIAPVMLDGDAVFCVNGSPFSARAMGLRTPNVTVVDGNSTRQHEQVTVATQQAWRGLSTRHLLLIEAGTTARRGKRVIKASGMQYGVFSSITRQEREQITIDICGAPLGDRSTHDRISTGIFTAILAAWSGATSIVLVGFSMSGGHAYIDRPTTRWHTGGDGNFLRSHREMPCPMETTSPELAEAFDMRRVSSVGAVESC